MSGGKLTKKVDLKLCQMLLDGDIESQRETPSQVVIDAYKAAEGAYPC